MIRRLPLALLLSGCFSTPPYDPDEAVTFTEAGAGGTISGSFRDGLRDDVRDVLRFELRFPDGDGFHFPNALMLDGVDVMGHDPAQGCNQEDEVGILISPAPRISASGAAPRVTSSLTSALRGPAVAQVKLEWATRLACEGARSPGGTSTFTVFPDGRIVRFDTLADPSPVTLTSAFPCACDAATNSFTVSTFWTIARASFSKFYHSGASGTELPVPDADDVIDKTNTQCLDDGTHQVAFAWRDNLEAIGTKVRGSSGLLGFGLDFQFEGSMLPAFSWENSSALLLGRTGCPEALARAAEHIAPSALMVNDAEVAPSPRDGIYGGDIGNGAEPGIELQGGDHFELTGVTQTPYAVWLRFPRAVDALRAMRSGAMGVWYVPQRVDDRSWIIFFKEPLLLGHRITVEPI